jgi:hypothetical protein
VPADRDSQHAGLTALIRVGGDRDDPDGHREGSERAIAPDLPPRAREPDNDWSWPPREQSWRPQPEPSWKPQELDSLDNAAQFRAALSSFGPRKASKLNLRLSRWKPRYWPLVTSFLIMLVAVGWFAAPHSGPLGWPLSILWTWPVISTIVGIRGISRTRNILRTSRARWHDFGPAICEDFLAVVVPTIGRHDTYPALERSVLSYIAYLPACFPELRIDLVIEEGCEAEERIFKLAARSPLVRIVTVPRTYCTPNGTRFKARANHYAHELRRRDGEAGHVVRQTASPRSRALGRLIPAAGRRSFLTWRLPVPARSTSASANVPWASYRSDMQGSGTPAGTAEAAASRETTYRRRLAAQRRSAAALLSPGFQMLADF